MKYSFTVTVECESFGEAAHVMGERLGFDEDYGFPYKLEWTEE